MTPAAISLPETLSLKPGKLKWALVAAIGLGFVAVAVWVFPPYSDPLVRWLTGGFFGLVAAASLPGLTGFRSGLDLHQDGFTCRTIGRSWSRRWGDCSVFVPIHMGANSFVGFDAKSDDSAHPRLTGLNRIVAGAGGMLPDTYGMKARDLADLMNRFRNRALGLKDTP